MRGRVHASIQTDGTLDDIFGDDQKHQVHLLTDEEARIPLHLNPNDCAEGADTDVVSLLNEHNEGRIKVPEQESDNHQGSDTILLIQNFAREVCNDVKQTAIERYLHSGRSSDPG